MAASLGRPFTRRSKTCSTWTSATDQRPAWVAPEVGEAFLKDRWNEEKDAFHATPRHGRWKDDRWKEAVDGHRGGIDLLLRWVGVEGLSHERITAALWTRVQERMIAVEGELISRDGRLGGVSTCCSTRWTTPRNRGVGGGRPQDGADA